MAEYIDKAKVVAEIEREKKHLSEKHLDERGAIIAYEHILSFINTLEVKEVVHYNDSDMDTVLSELGLEPDSSFANSLKNAFYKAFDSYITKRKIKEL